MSDVAQKGEGSAVRPRPRAWWQWVLGIGLLGAAAVSLAVRYIPGLQPRHLVRMPRWEISVPPELKPVEVIPAAPGAFAGCNLILVSLDTTRADYIGCYGHEKIQTPTLDGLAGEGVLFSDAIAPGSTTLPSHATMMTGLHPYHHGARANGVYRLGDGPATLAETLSENGYATAAVISALVLNSSFGLDRGFDEYFEDLPEKVSLGLKTGLERYADGTTDRAIAWLREHAAEPSFLWVHYFDAHAPYSPPSPYDEQYKLPYVGEIAFVDAQLGRLVGELEQLGLTDTTLIVVVGDHGEALGQHGEATHGVLVYDETVRVPLIMRCGRRLGGGVHFTRQVGVVDIMPTALSLLGVGVPENLDGLDLTQPLPPSRPLFVETLEGLMEYGWAAPLAASDGPMKYIHGSEPELYDRAKDPFEARNLIDSQPGVAAALKQRLAEFYDDDLDLAEAIEPPEKLSAEALEQFAALGYAELGAGGIPPPESRPDPKKAMAVKLKAELVLRAAEDVDLDEAIPKLEAIAREHPDSFPVWRFLGEAYTTNEEFEKAADAFERALVLRPGSPYVLEDFAKARQMSGDLDGAAQLYQKVLDQYPDMFRPAAELGAALAGQRKFEEAIPWVTKAFRMKPGSSILMDQMVAAHNAAGRADEATAILDEELAADPDLVAVRNSLASQLATAQQYARAVTLLREGVERSPQTLELVNNLAYLLATCPDQSVRMPYEAAVMMERVCTETKYEHPGYLRTLGIVYGYSQRVDEAIALLEKAQRIATDAGRAGLAATIAEELAYFLHAKQQGVSPMIRGFEGFAPKPDTADDKPDGG